MNLKTLTLAAAALALAAPLTSAHAADMHPIMERIGEHLAHNAICKNGAPISLDSLVANLPLDPDIIEFIKDHHAQAHQWAMEGVNKVAKNPSTVHCGTPDAGDVAAASAAAGNETVDIDHPEVSLPYPEAVEANFKQTITPPPTDTATTAEPPRRFCDKGYCATEWLQLSHNGAAYAYDIRLDNGAAFHSYCYEVALVAGAAGPDGWGSDAQKRNDGNRFCYTSQGKAWIDRGGKDGGSWTMVKNLRERFPR